MDGITGIYSPGDSDLVQKVFLATGSLQHRGKTSAGIAIGTGKGIKLFKDTGSLADVIDPEMVRVFQELDPFAAIGNVGYTKSHLPDKRNSEPIVIQPRGSSPFQLALTMGGRVLAVDELKERLEKKYIFQTENRTELVGALLHDCIEKEGISFEAGRILIDTLHGRGTFALTALVYDGRQSYLLAINDDRAFEPFCFGRIDGAFIISSESISHRRLGGFIEREYRGAEMTICGEGGVEMKRLREETPLPDVFQGIYFGNVASIFQGKEIFQLRRELGLSLAQLYRGTEADVVVPNPDSGRGVSYGIAEGLGLPLAHGLVKQSQAIRTFQEGRIGRRTVEVGLKFAGVDSLLRGKRVIMGDDSIVKGSVSQGGSVWTAYNSGAVRLEFWVSYGPIFFPSFKEWPRGRECLDELAVQRAFRGEHPYDKPLEEINRRVARLIGVERVCYNTRENIQAAGGPGSFQAMDADYPILEEFWPDWIKEEVDRFSKLSFAF